MEFYGFVLGAFAVWRITHLLQAEDGPGDVIVRIRRATGNGFWGRLLDCFYCLSIWIAAGFAAWLGSSAADRVLLWPALSGAAILLERLTTPPAPYWREDDTDVLLRQDEK
jgi:hypothetical protein